MITYRFTLRVVLPAILSVLGLAGPLVGADARIQPGDKTVTTHDGTPVKSGEATLLTLGQGVELTADATRGDWVRVTVDGHGEKTTGWIHTRHLARAGSSNDRMAANTHFRRAIDLLNRGDLDGAMERLNHAIRLDPRHAEAYQARGDIWRRKNEPDKAIADCTEAIRVLPPLAAAYATRGAAWSQKGEFDKTIADCDEAIRLDPELAWAYGSRGVAHEAQGNLDQAIEDYTQAIELDENYAWAYANRGDAWRKKGDLEKAIADCTEAVRLDPQFAWAYNIRGLVNGEKGDLDQAIADHTECIRLDPTYAWAYKSRGMAHARNKDRDAATRDFCEAVRLAPQDPGICNGIAWFLATCSDAEVRDGELALECAAKAVELKRDADFLDTLAAAYAENGEFDKAVDTETQALEEAAKKDASFDPTEYRDRLKLYQQNKPYRETNATLAMNAVAQQDKGGSWLRQSERALADAQALAKNIKARAKKLHGTEFHRAQQELEKAIAVLNRQSDELDAAIDNRNDSTEDLSKPQEILSKAEDLLLEAQDALDEAEQERDAEEDGLDQERTEKLKQELSRLDVAIKPRDDVVALRDAELMVEAKSVGSVRKGGNCTVEQVQDSWLWVRSGDIRGWIDRRAVIGAALMDWYKRLPDNSSVEQSGTSRAKFDGILFEIVGAGQRGSIAHSFHGATYNGVPLPWSLATTYSNLGIFTRKHGDRRELGLYLTAGQPLSGPFSGLFEAAFAAKSYGNVQQGDYVFVNPKTRLILVNGERRRLQ